jgi:hypothetical protein
VAGDAVRFVDPAKPVGIAASSAARRAIRAGAALARDDSKLGAT